VQRFYSYNALLFCSFQLIFVSSKDERKTDGTVITEYDKQLHVLQPATEHTRQLVSISKRTLCFGNDVLADMILAAELT